MALWCGIINYIFNKFFFSYALKNQVGSLDASFSPSPPLSLTSWCKIYCLQQLRLSWNLGWEERTAVHDNVFLGLFYDFQYLRTTRCCWFLMNCKGFGRKRLRPHKDTLLAWVWRKWEKPLPHSRQLVSKVRLVRTKHFSIVIQHSEGMLE
jgi:hypothetical protein